MDWKELITPLNIIIASSAVAAIILAIIITSLVKRWRLKKRLTRIISNPDIMEEEEFKYFSESRYARYGNLIEKYALKNEPELLRYCGIDSYWLKKLKKNKSKKTYQRVLEYYPEKGLFTCFLIALENKRYASLFLKWLDSSDDFLILRKVALSGSGEEFDGEKALSFFGDFLPQIREMTGDPQWASRYFAIKILLYDMEDQSMRAIWESTHDSHPLIRKTISREFQTENREQLYNELFKLYLNDPVLEVRATAKERINKDFTDIYNINIEALDTPSALHALEHLSPFSKADEDIALQYLSHENLELRFAAARFLEERGALDRLIEQVDLGDREEIDRVEKLLNNSCEVHISSFLSKASKSQNPASLLVAVDILKESGDISLIDPLCGRIFNLPQDTVEHKDLFDRAINCINIRGDEKSFIRLRELLLKYKYDRDYAVKILDSFPERSSFLIIPTLLDILNDNNFEDREALRAAIIRMPTELYIQELLKILRSGRAEYSHLIRKDALKILIEIKKSFCLQTILENLPILPLQEARDFAPLLVEYDQEEFNSLVKIIFEADDASVRASIISILPAVKGKQFLKDIKAALNDADPQVRISSIWSLVDFGETKTVSQAITLLRDPVEEVRIEAANAIGATGTDTALQELKTVLFDENEVFAVKKPSIIGLSHSESILSIEILCELMDVSNEYDNELIQGLALKIKKKEIKRLIEFFKDGSPEFRDKITLVFSKMKEDGEVMLLELLKEDIAALKPFICQVLENTGFVENQIRFLKHRDPKIRRKAASELSFIGTSSAFRGIVLAARDSDQEVRISVTKALEKLNNQEGTEILKGLQEDPDKKVRKYTAWALERIESKNMD